MVYHSNLDDTTVTIEVDAAQQCGIMLSGGLDSAVLMAMIIDSGIENIVTFTINKADGSHHHASEVIAHFNTKFGLNIPPPILVGDPTLHHSQQGRSAVLDILQNHPVDVLFNALNKNPPELNDDPNAPNRTVNSQSKTLRLPFASLYKTHIIDFMYQIGQEDLINVTHTCTERTMGRCGVCWQCRERQWAFTELNKIDTGTQ